MKKLYKKISKTFPKSSKPSSPHQQQKDPSNNDSSSSQSTGLKLIHTNHNATVDVIAIHGDGGHWSKSWTDIETKVFWLRDILPRDIPQIRVFSYGYASSKTSSGSPDASLSVEDTATRLLKDIETCRVESNTGQRPIIFLAHSFGGMLIKGALATSTQLHPNNRSSTYGILFFGVPRNAEHGFNNLASSSSQFPPSEQEESPAMKALKRDLNWLTESNIRYSEISDCFVTRYFVEAIPGQDIPSEDEVAVEDDLGAMQIQLGKTHGAMIRYPDGEDRDYQKVLKRLVVMVSEAERNI